MSLQDYDDALQNAVKSFNVHMRSIADEISTDLAITCEWYPGDKPEEPVYPHICGWFLRLGDPNAGRKKMKSRIQVDVFTNQRQEALARRIAGRVFKKLGIDIVNTVMECDIPQVDYENPGNPTPLHEMTLEALYGWEDQSDQDPAVTHLFTEFFLFHE